MSYLATGSENWINEKVIDFSKLEPDFMPNYQKEIECYKKSIIKEGRDERGRKVPPTAWPRDRQPGEMSYYLWLKKVTDEDMNWNPALDERGAPIEGTGAKHIVNQIIRVKTKDGQFLLTNGELIGYDYNGNPLQHTCRHPEEWMETQFRFVRLQDTSGRVSMSCQGPMGYEMRYTMPFNEKNLKQLAKLRDGDNISFSLVDQTKGEKAIAIPNQSLIEETIKFFLQDFDYLYEGRYVSKEQKLLNMRYAELLNGGKTLEQAREIIEGALEDGNPPSPKNDKKSGVA